MLAPGEIWTEAEWLEDKGLRDKAAGQSRAERGKVEKMRRDHGKLRLDPDHLVKGGCQTDLRASFIKQSGPTQFSSSRSCTECQ